MIRALDWKKLLAALAISGLIAVSAAALIGRSRPAPKATPPPWP